jgi:hypothetical protein
MKRSRARVNMAGRDGAGHVTAMWRPSNEESPTMPAKRDSSNRDTIDEWL